MENREKEFEEFIRFLDEEIEKRPDEGAKKELFRLLVEFHRRRLPLTPESFQDFVIRAARQIHPTTRFEILLILANAFTRLKNLEEVRV